MRRRKPLDHPHNEVASLMFYWRCERERWLEGSPRAEQVPLPLRPCVTLSVQRGLREKELGRLLRHELRYALLDEALLTYSARYLALRCEWVENLPEPQRRELRAWMENSLPALLKKYTDEIAAQCEVIKTGLLHGGLIVLNPMANLLLGETPGARLRFIAEKEPRVENLIVFEGFTQQQAIYEIERADYLQAEWVQNYFGSDIDDPSLYDAIIDAAGMNIDEMISAVVEAMCAKAIEIVTRSKRFMRKSLT